MSQKKIQLQSLISAVTAFTIEGQAEPVSLTVPQLGLFFPIEGWRKRVLETGVNEDQFAKLVVELGTVSAQNPNDAAATWGTEKFPQPAQMQEIVDAVKAANEGTVLTARQADPVVAIGNWLLDLAVEIADEGDLKANDQGEIEVEEILAFVQLSLEPTAPIATAEDVAAALKVPVVASRKTATAEKPATEAPVEQVATPVVEAAKPADQNLPAINTPVFENLPANASADDVNKHLLNKSAAMNKAVAAGGEVLKNMGNVFSAMAESSAAGDEAVKAAQTVPGTVSIEKAEA